MTVLNYKIHGGIALLDKCVYGTSERVTISVDGLSSGTVSIGGVGAPLKKTGTVIDLSRLYDGEYTPTLRGADRSLIFEPIIKLGGKIRPSTFETRVLGALVKRLEESDRLLADAMERLGRVEEKLGDIRLTK